MSASENELTVKQKEVLSLLQAGKTNKDIATALGIRAGTVKQHLVTIFRKLGVNNRTMAAMSAPIDTPEPQDLCDLETALEASEAQPPLTSTLERRPCVLLIMTLTDVDNSTDLTELQHQLENIVAPYQGVIIGRKIHQREMVFGLDKTDLFDPLYALHTARSIAKLWQKAHPDKANQLKAHLSCGIFLASMDDAGNWTEEVLMSVLLGQARQAIQQVPAGHLAITSAVRQAIAWQGVKLDSTQVSAPFDYWTLSLQEQDHSLIGHEQLLMQLSKRLKNPFEHNPIALIIGEKGIGKSHILAQLGKQLEGQEHCSFLYFRILPAEFDSWLAPDALIGSLQQLNKCLDQHLHTRTLLIDDVDRLSVQDRNKLLYMIEHSNHKAVMTSTHLLNLQTLRNIPQFHVHRLNDDEMYELIGLLQHQQGLSFQAQKAAIAQVKGIPLYLIAHLHAHQAQSSLLLAMHIMAQIDHLSISHAMLRHLLMSKQLSRKQLITDSIKRAIVDALKKGVLTQQKQGNIGFQTPIFAPILHHLLVLPSLLTVESNLEKL